MKKDKAVVLFSGGQDSTVCLFYALETYKEIHPLVISYGQKHSVEVKAARTIADMAGVLDKTEFLHLPGDILQGGTLLNQKSCATGSVADTWVPYRNMLFLTIALNRALVLEEGSSVVIGVNSMDYSGYPDCRPDFIDSMLETALEAGGRDIYIETPLLFHTKKEIVELGYALSGCMEALAYSHTCYKGEIPPCGVCPSCILRAKGFEEAGVKDPLIQRLTYA